MNKKLATIILVVMFAALAGLVIATQISPASVGSTKTLFTETR